MTARRFSGVSRLYGEKALAAFQAAHVCVVGVGGVGSWVVEALARSAIGHLSLIDLDMVAESNTNRQIQALAGQFGRAKVDVLKERVLDINPACVVNGIEDFVSVENLPDLLGAGFDYVVDAIDATKIKAAMIAFCVSRGMPIITSGGAGGKIDPLRIRCQDLSQTIQDPLLARVRSELRKHYGFPKGDKKFKVPAVYSDEPLQKPETGCAPEGGLHCSGYGSGVCLTAPFGFFCSGHGVKPCFTGLMAQALKKAHGVYWQALGIAALENITNRL